MRAMSRRGKVIPFPRSPAPPSPAPTFTEVRRCRDQGEALVVRGLLESRGISAVLRSHIAQSVHPFSVGDQGKGEVIVLVADRDAHRARRISRAPNNPRRGAPPTATIRAHLRRYGALDRTLNVQRVPPRVACHRAPPRSWTLLIALAGFLRQAPRNLRKGLAPLPIPPPEQRIAPAKPARRPRRSRRPPPSHPQEPDCAGTAGARTAFPSNASCEAAPDGRQREAYRVEECGETSRAPQTKVRRPACLARLRGTAVEGAVPPQMAHHRSGACRRDPLER